LRSINSARSKQLEEETTLLKSAAAAQDRVRAAAAALDQERAQADALEQQAAALRERLRGDSLRDDSTVNGDDFSVNSEAEAIARLHSQAAAVQNIKNLIPIVLDLQSSNYSKWRGYVLLILGRFALKDHVLSDVPRHTDPAWPRMDDVVVSWLFNTISPDLLDVIHERDGVTARAAWLGIEQQFLNNRESRAMLLDAEFRTLAQGALSIDDFCRKMKGMADALADLGEPVNDRTLVLNILRGLNERFQFMAQLIPRQKPFPSFVDVRADLRLAELNMATPPAPPSALVTSSTSKPLTSAPLPGPAPPRPPQPAGGGLVWRQPRSPPPWRPRTGWSRWTGWSQWPTRRVPMALHLQSLDWVHSHVAWLQSRWFPWPSTPRRRTARPAGRPWRTAGPDGRSWPVPGAPAGASAGLVSSATGAPFYVVAIAMGYSIPRQRFQYRLPQPSTEHLELGGRLRCHLAHRLQPWYGHHVTILFFSPLHHRGQRCHSPSCWHWLLYYSWSFSSE